MLKQDLSIIMDCKDLGSAMYDTIRETLFPVIIDKDTYSGERSFKEKLEKCRRVHTFC